MNLQKLTLKSGDISLRPLVRSDAAWLAALYGVDSNMAMIPGGVRNAQESARHLDLLLAHWKRHGIGMWVIDIDRCTQPAGYAGLRYVELDGINQLEFGLIIDKPFWGKGIGSKVSNLILDFVDSSLTENKTIAFIQPENTASQHLLGKFGFLYSRDVEHRGAKSQLWLRYNIHPQQ